jgi:predicted RNase H-like nuclease (RuvC/YqgF family)
MWYSLDKEYQRIEQENDKLKALIKECREVIEGLVKQNQELKKQLEVQKPEKPNNTWTLKPSIGLRFKVKRVNVTEDKFGAITHGTKEINILQQWYSVSGSEFDENGEWRDVRTEGSLY